MTIRLVIEFEKGKNMQARFESALAAKALTALVQEMTAEGISQVEIYHHFEQFRAFLRNAVRETDEDEVIDVMDCIVGWCSPHMRLFPHSLTNEEIQTYKNSLSRP